MNYPTIRGQQVQPNTCGLLAMDNHATAFWQSRETVAGHRANPPRLIDIPALAQAVRATFQHEEPAPC